MKSIDQNKGELSPEVKNIHEGLITGCRENDRKSQVKVYELYCKAMYNTALRIINDTAEAEDIMQESFLDAFRKISDYRGDSSFGTWLRRIVVNRSIDALKKTRQSVPLDESTLEVPAASEDENGVEILFARAESIRRAIHALPEHYRVILSLFLLEGYDHEEIAQVLGISNDLSRIRYFRAKQKLIENLKQSGQHSVYSMHS
jgi:RNA polymerase sigma-70 factor (ECF subfamily)